MDLGGAQLLAASTDPKAVQSLLQHSSDPAAGKAVAQQFSALFMQSLMQQSDGSAIPMTEGMGGGIVNSMFVNTMGQKAAAGEKLGLADMMLRSIQAKQQQANGATGAEATGAAAAAVPPTAGSPASSKAAAAANGTQQGFPLSPYWQGHGLRPLAVAAAAATASGGKPAAAFAALARTQTGFSLPGSYGAAAASTAMASSATAGSAAQGATLPTEISGFTQQLMPLLRKAGQQLGVSPRTLLAQAAIETGWGRSVVGNNIFGVKAGSSWTGATVTAATHEYEDGQYVAIHDAFRSYPSLDAAVQDFVSLVSSSSRYRAALNTGDDVTAYAQALIAGGWATDINYVHKLETVAGGRAAAAATAAGAAPLPPIKLVPS